MNLMTISSGRASWVGEWVWNGNTKTTLTLLTLYCCYSAAHSEINKYNTSLWIGCYSKCDRRHCLGGWRWGECTTWWPLPGRRWAWRRTLCTQPSEKRLDYSDTSTQRVRLGPDMSWQLIMGKSALQSQWQYNHSTLSVKFTNGAVLIHLVRDC